MFTPFGSSNKTSKTKECCKKWKDFNFCPVCNTIFNPPPKKAGIKMVCTIKAEPIKQKPKPAPKKFVWLGGKSPFVFTIYAVLKMVQKIRKAIGV